MQNARINIKGAENKDNVVATVKRRVAAIIPNHGAIFTLDGNVLVISVNPEKPTQKNAQIVEISNGAVTECLHIPVC